MLTDFKESFGGRGANFLMSSKIFGIDVFLIAPVGIDFKHIGYLKHLKNNNVDISGLYHSKKLITPRAFIFHKGEDTRTFFYGSVLDSESDSYIQHTLSLLKEKNYCVLYATSGIQKLNEKALLSSKAQINVYSPAQDIAYHTAKSLRNCLKSTNIILLNSDEAYILKDKLNTSLSNISKSFDMVAVIVTLGDKGSKLYVKGNEIFIPAYKPSRKISAVGAGDAYAGAFVANYIKTNNLTYSARVASATASFVIEGLGGQSTIPDLKAVFRRLHE